MMMGVISSQNNTIHGGGASGEALPYIANFDSNPSGVWSFECNHKDLEGDPFTPPTGEGVWEYKTTNLAGGTSGEISMHYTNAHISDDSYCRCYSPAINATGKSSLTVNYRRKLSIYSSGGYSFRVLSSTDAINWVVEDTLIVTVAASAAAVSATINSNLGGDVYIAFEIYGDMYYMDTVQFDNVNIS